LRTNNDGEFTLPEFVSYYADEGIERHFSPPYNPQQNDIVERRNQTMVAMTRLSSSEGYRPGSGVRQ
jgi:transposase InsO family protein